MTSPVQLNTAQDGKPKHTACAMPNFDYLKKQKIAFIEPEMWPQTAQIEIVML